MKVDMLAFGAHPDDIELGCAGTLSTHAQQGKTLALVDLTQGEMGTRGTVAQRLAEAQEAAKILGAVARENMQLPDGFFTIDEATLLKAVTLIRKYQPTVVFANAESDRHPDHPRAAQLIKQACFLAGLAKVETTYNGQVQAPHRASALYHYIQFRESKPHFIVDITQGFDTKLAAIKAHASQFYNPNSTEPETVISSPQFLNNVAERASNWGRLIGCTYGEGFTLSADIGVKNVFDLLHVK